jgi:hypothetical protein
MANGGTDEQQTALTRERLTWALFGLHKQQHLRLYRWMRRRPELLHHCLHQVAGRSDEVAALLFARLILAFCSEQDVLAMARELGEEERARRRRFAELLIPPAPPRIGGDWCRGAPPPLIRVVERFAELLALPLVPRRPPWNTTPWDTTPWLVPQ